MLSRRAIRDREERGLQWTGSLLGGRYSVDSLDYDVGRRCAAGKGAAERQHHSRTRVTEEGTFVLVRPALESEGAIWFWATTYPSIATGLQRVVV